MSDSGEIRGPTIEGRSLLVDGFFRRGRSPKARRRSSLTICGFCVMGRSHDGDGAIAVYPRRSIEQENRYRHRSLLQSEQFRVVYLEDFLGIPSEQIGVQLMQLIVSKDRDTAQYLQGMVQRLQGKTDPPNQAIMELISTVMVYKFPQLSREEIESMFTVSDLKQTKVYQEALDEGVEIGIEQGLEQGLEQGRTEEAQSLVLRLLERRFGAIALETSARIRALPLEQIEALGEALLDFSDRADLDQWLKLNQ